MNAEYLGGRTTVSRRDALLSVCSFCCLVASSRAEGQGAEPFVCLAIDSIPTDPEILNFDKVYGSVDIVNLDQSPTDVKLSPYGTALASNRWLQSDGLTPGTGKITLGIYFIGGTSDERNTVKSAASDWLNTDAGKRFSFEFDVPAVKSHARIALDPGDQNWSYIGRKNLNYKSSVKTMNIAQVMRHVAQHELGHLLCLEHEHQFPGDTIRWHEAEVISYMKKLKVPEAVTRQQILTKFGLKARCIGDPNMNPESVMMYPILPGWADYVDASGSLKPLIIAGNSLISDRDISCIKGLYQI
jgi:hypothetical protein